MKGYYPKPKRNYFKAEFTNRQKARAFCRNRRWEEGLTIVHPDGTEEAFEYTPHWEEWDK